MGGTSGVPMNKEGGNESGLGTGINSSGAPTTNGNPQNIPFQPATYNPYSTYSPQNYSLTPQSGYTGIAQQLQQAMGLTPQAYAAPRTDLTTMYASPWSKLYGGPAAPTFAQYWNQPANMGTAPPPGTPGYLQNNANTPPPSPNTPPPPVTTPPPTGGPPTSAPPSGVPPVTTPPATPGNPIPRTQHGNGNFSYNGRFANLAPPTGATVGTTDGGGRGNAVTPKDMNMPTQGGLLQDMNAAGLNTGQMGAGLLMMAGGRQDAARANGLGPLDNEALIQGSKQGVNPRDVGKNKAFYDKLKGKWQSGGGDYVSPGNTFNYPNAPRAR